MGRWDSYDYETSDGDKTGGNSVLNNSGSGTSRDTPSVAPTTPTVINSIVYAVGPQVFRVVCTGLKPSTLHQAYLINKLVSSDCAPLYNYNYGAQLISDNRGNLSFDYKFNPSNSPYSTYTSTEVTGGVVAVIPVGNQKFSVSSADGNSTAYNYIQQK